MRNFSHLVLAGLLLIMSCLTPNYARALPDRSPLTPQPDMLEKYDLVQKPLSNDEEKDALEILSLPNQYLGEINFLLKKLHEKSRKELDRSSLDEIAEKLAKRKDSDAIAWEEEGVGKAELTTIGKGEGSRFFTKVRHNGLKTTFLFVDRNQIDLQEIEQLPDQSLSKDEYNEELETRREIARHWRKLLASQIKSEWNPEFVYKNIDTSTQKNNGPVLAETDAETAAQEIEELGSLSAEELTKKPWYKKLNEKYFDLALTMKDSTIELKDKWKDIAIKNEQSESLQKDKETVVIFYDSTQAQILSSHVYRPDRYKEHSWTSKKRYKYFFEEVVTYWRAIWERPSYDEELWKKEKGLGKLRVLGTGDYLLGIGMGVVLSSLTYGVSLLAPQSLPHGLMASDVARISFEWSVFFGVFSKTWQNFAYRGNDFNRFCKNWITGLGQSYHFNLASDERLWIFDPNGKFDFKAFMIHFNILMNQSIKQYSKTSMQEVAKFRADVGEASGTVKVRDYKIVFPSRENAFMSSECIEKEIPTGNFAGVKSFFKAVTPTLEPFERDTKIPRKNFEGQLVQLVSTPIGLLSRFGWAVYGLPIGHILYAALGPLGQWIAIKYKNQYADQIEEIYGAEHPLSVRTRKAANTEKKNWDNLRLYLPTSIAASAVYYANAFSESIESILGTDSGIAKMVKKGVTISNETLTNMAVNGTPYTEPLGFYVKAIPVRVSKATVKLSTWFFNKAAARSYEMIYGPIIKPVQHDFYTCHSLFR